MLDLSEITPDDAYQQGYAARMRQTARMSENPFSVGREPDLYDAWKQGWQDRAGWEQQVERR
jgi:hypothetical protein